MASEPPSVKPPTLRLATSPIPAAAASAHGDTVAYGPPIPENRSDIERAMARDTFATHVGIRLLEVGDGKARAELELDGRHLNGAGLAHGAAIFSLADFAFAAASNSHGTVALGINASISFVKSVTEGKLVAEARETSFHPKIATYTVEVRDAAGNLIALFQGMVYRKKEAI